MGEVIDSILETEEGQEDGREASFACFARWAYAEFHECGERSLVDRCVFLMAL